MFAKFFNNQNEKKWQQYSKQRKICIRTIRLAKHVIEKSPLEQLMTKIKNDFFKLVTMIIASRANHTSRMLDVDSLNDYLANIGQFKLFQFIRHVYTQVHIQFFLYPTVANEVYSLIKKSKTTNFPGLDGLSNNLPEIAGPMISDFLAVIFTRCIQVGYFPNILKIAKIKPLFKICDTQNPKNYHPISLLPSLTKIVEKNLVKRLESFWEKCDELNSKQYGFRKGKSTLNALIDLTVATRAKFIRREKTTCAILDLSKVFDTVNHGILLKKLEAYGARAVVLQQLPSFLQKKKTVCTIGWKNFRSLRYKCRVTTFRLHYVLTSQLTENSIQYKALKFYNMLTENGLLPVTRDQEQNIRLRRFYRDILILHLNDNNDILSFFKYNVVCFY